MGEVKHTPAPWHVYPTEYEDGSEAYDVMADGAAITIASPPSEADARLISAAPDLLAALRGFLHADPDVFAAELAAARAAIARAAGGPFVRSTPLGPLYPTSTEDAAMGGGPW